MCSTRSVCAGSVSTKWKDEPAEEEERLSGESPHSIDEAASAKVSHVTTAWSGLAPSELSTCCGVVAGMAARVMAPRLYSSTTAS